MLGGGDDVIHLSVSEIAASIAVGGTLHPVSQRRKRRKIDQERLQLARCTHRAEAPLLAYSAAQVGDPAGRWPVPAGDGRSRQNVRIAISAGAASSSPISWSRRLRVIDTPAMSRDVQ